MRCERILTDALAFLKISTVLENGNRLFAADPLFKGFALTPAEHRFPRDVQVARSLNLIDSFARQTVEFLLPLIPTPTKPLQNVDSAPLQRTDAHDQAAFQVGFSPVAVESDTSVQSASCFWLTHVIAALVPRAG